MLEYVNLAIVWLAVAAAIPALFLALQITAALLPKGAPYKTARALAPRVAVLVPAHNEEAVIAKAVGSILRQLPPNGRLLVIADNCTDGTALAASLAGAEAALRNDLTLVGKGYALNYGMSLLRADPPQVVVFIDADCVLSEGSLKVLTECCAATDRPVQARYSMLAQPTARAIDKLSHFAWVVKTWIRPMGSARLGVPCQLLGSGMAFPFEALGQVDLATSHLAEDQKLGADLALLGKAPYYCPQAHVISGFPRGEAGTRQQRTRWMHGHLAIIREYFKPLTIQALLKASPRRFAFALDLCIPPLSLFLLAYLAIVAATLVWFAASGYAIPLIVSSAAMICLVVALCAAWRLEGQDIVTLRDFAALPKYVVIRLAALARFFVDRQIEWVRTPR
jgi:cellulose synthase/poly-beta-1,6-N-acetylglucosamine synthase-like glycosyltransferase